MGNISILIVEDEVISTHYLIGILESLNINNIYDATCMEEALDIVREHHIDLVFMDINIDGAEDGITCAKVINEEYFIPIIFTTAYGDSQTILEASDTNSFGYLIKPFEENTVEATLLIALKRIEQFTQKKQHIHRINDEVIDLGMNQKYNLSNKTFYVNNIAIDITRMELNVLYVFCINLNQNISYDILREKAWENKEVSNSTIRDTVSRLKKKTINLNIENVINYGYILKI